MTDQRYQSARKRYDEEVEEAAKKRDEALTANAREIGNLCRTIARELEQCSREERYGWHMAERLALQLNDHRREAIWQHYQDRAEVERLQYLQAYFQAMNG